MLIRQIFIGSDIEKNHGAENRGKRCSCLNSIQIAFCPGSRAVSKTELKRESLITKCVKPEPVTLENISVADALCLSQDKS